MPNGNEMEDLDTLVEMLEYDESDESDEMAERARRRRPPRTAPRTASGSGLYTARPTQNHVTQAQLQTALAKVSEQIKVNSTAITTLTTRVNTVASEQATQAAAMRRQTEAVRKDVGEKIQLLTILPLISRPRSEQITVPDGAGGQRTVTVLTDGGDTLSTLLPLLLVGGLGGGSGLGGSSGSAGSSGSSDSFSPLLLILALSGGLGR